MYIFLVNKIITTSVPKTNPTEICTLAHDRTENEELTRLLKISI